MSKPLIFYAGANVQAELYHQLQLAGIDSRLEVVLAIPEEYRKQGMRYWCRLDLVVLSASGGPAILIEVKGYKHRIAERKAAWWRSKQSTKYRILGLPVMLVACLADIPDAIAKIKGIIGDGLSEGVRDDGF
jgi:hypothetical protein